MVHPLSCLQISNPLFFQNEVKSRAVSSPSVSPLSSPNHSSNVSPDVRTSGDGADSGDPCTGDFHEQNMDFQVIAIML